MNKIEQNTGKPTAMYIHGLASGSNSNTGRELQKLFPQYQWILPEVGEELEQAIDKINGIVAQYNPQIVIGTSYGGLMTMYANAPNATKIICNPAINADVSLAKNIGYGTHQYFCQRQDGATHFDITPAICQGIAHYKATHQVIPGINNHAVFSPNDELLGKEATLDNATMAYTNGFVIHLDPKGGHRMSSSTMAIVKHIINMLNV